MKIYKSIWFDPYKDSRPRLKTNHKHNYGVYAVRNAAGKIVYIGYSASNLYKTIYRHFQQWRDKQYRVTFPKSGYQIKILFTTQSVAPRLERLLIQKYKPKLNLHTYEETAPPAEDLRKYEENIIFARPNEEVTDF